MSRAILLLGMVVAGTTQGARTAPDRYRAAPSDLVVSAAWLSSHLNERDLVILQVGHPEEYKKEHIPGARYLPSGLESSDRTAAMPTAAELKAKLEATGVGDRSHVIAVFSGNDFESATRVLFLLGFAGIEHASLLDGGVEAWKRSRFPVTAAMPTVAPGVVTRRTRTESVVDFAWVQSHLQTPHARIVDARAASYFSGPPADNMGMVAGHIPRATNVPFNSLFDDAGLLLSKTALEAKFRAAGVTHGDTVVTYCHLGIQATVVVLAARVVGIPVRMYAASFHDWSDRKLPTEGGKP